MNSAQSPHHNRARLSREGNPLRKAAAITVAALSLLTAVALAPAPVSAQERPDYTDTACPELTDSIYRLYRAYLLREPEEGGFDYWVDQFASGSRNLDLISRFFKESPEFIDRYGQLDNAAFVTLIYANVMERTPDLDGFNFWVEQLDNGMDRGTVMLFFSESEEYVDKTDTWAPLAGYLRWYPIGTRFACGWDDVSIRQVGVGDHFDVLIANTGTETATYPIVTTLPDGTTTQLDRTLDPEHYHYFYNGSWSELTQADFDLNETLYWTYVEYPTSMPDDRPGWGELRASTSASFAAPIQLVEVGERGRRAVTP